MVVRELMRKDVITVAASDALEEVIDLFLREHIHGAPVLDESGALLGIVTQQDLFFASATRTPDPTRLAARDVMTTPAVSVGEEMEVRELCRLMHRLRIHRVPVVRDGLLTGIVSSLDVCGALGAGRLR